MGLFWNFGEDEVSPCVRDPPQSSVCNASISLCYPVLCVGRDGEQTEIQEKAVVQHKVQQDQSVRVLFSW